jgi:hypothetical protein
MSEQMRRMKARQMKQKKSGFAAGNTLCFKHPPNTRIDDFSAMPAQSEYAAMEREPNPHPQPWMTNPAALPKKPPKAAQSS